MSSFEEYANKYQTARMERRNGILQVTLHTEGQSLRWGFLPHGELPEAFHDIGADRENKVVILTGTGAEFSGPRATPGTSSFPSRPSIERIDRIHWEGRHLLMNLLNIEVPVISAINGPAWRHSEIPLLCDIVLAADTAQFQDSAHFMSDVVPGDGMHIVYPLLLGMNRGRYFLMTGQTLDAAEALRLGLVAEVLPPDKLMARAWELAEDLTRKPTLLLRYTRLLFTEYLRRQMHDLLGYGLAMESLAPYSRSRRRPPPEPKELLAIASQASASRLEVAEAPFSMGNRGGVYCRGARQAHGNCRPAGRPTLCRIGAPSVSAPPGQLPGGTDSSIPRSSEPIFSH